VDGDSLSAGGRHSEPAASQTRRPAPVGPSPSMSADGAWVRDELALVGAPPRRWTRSEAPVHAVVTSRRSRRGTTPRQTAIRTATRCRSGDWAARHGAVESHQTRERVPGLQKCRARTDLGLVHSLRGVSCDEYRRRGAEMGTEAKRGLAGRRHAAPRPRDLRAAPLGRGGVVSEGRGRGPCAGSPTGGAAAAGELVRGGAPLPPSRTTDEGRWFSLQRRGARPCRTGDHAGVVDCSGWCRPFEPAARLVLPRDYDMQSRVATEVDHGGCDALPPRRPALLRGRRRARALHARGDVGGRIAHHPLVAGGNGGVARNDLLGPHK
jgi:hypothetical protein